MFAIQTMPEGRLVWAETETPEIKPNEVLLEIHAAGINRADVLQLAGKYPPPAGWPDRLGLEAAGIIAAVGDKVAAEGVWSVGDRVCALLGSGGYAEYAAVPAELLLPIPKGLTFQQAAGLPEVCGAAYLFLRMEGELKAGQTLLITAGASGLASLMIPMAKAYGARVITTVHNDELEEKIRPLGADLVVNTARQKLADVMQAELAAGRGVDVAVDCLGGDTVGECLPYLNFDGRWIMIATLADDFTNVNMRNLYARRTRLIGTNLRSRTDAQKKQLLGEMARDLWPKLESGAVRPVIDSVWPVAEAGQAIEKMKSGKTAGKLILTVRE